LIESTGRALLAGEEYSTGAICFIRYLLCELSRCPSHVLQQVLGTADFAVANRTFFFLMKLVVAELKINQQVSVDELIQKGIHAGFLQASCDKPSEPECTAARRFITAAFGWTTMLYTTDLGPSLDQNALSLGAQQAQAFSGLYDLNEKTRRPLLEILGSVAGGLPVRDDGALAHSTVRLPTSADPAEDALHVSCLSIVTLSRLGNVELCWVKCIGSHLDFDVVHRRLNVFCLPSFCEVNRAGDTNLARYVILFPRL